MLDHGFHFATQCRRFRAVSNIVEWVTSPAGTYDDASSVKFLLTLPEIVWEASLGVYLTVKGFRVSSGFFGATEADERAATPAVAVG